MDIGIVVDTVTEVDDDKYKLETTNTLHAAVGKTLTDADDNEYAIVEVENDSYIIVTSDTTPVSGTFTRVRPVYVKGTPRAVSTERSRAMIASQERQYPLLWYLEFLNERIEMSALKALDTQPSLRLFFLDETNRKDWTTQDHHDYVIQPMANFARKFLDELSNNDHVGNPSQFEWNVKMIRHAQFGINTVNYKSTDQFNHMAGSLSEYVSGVEVRIELPLLNNYC